MKKLLILTLSLFSYSAVAADIYEFNSGNSSAPAPAVKARPATETKVTRHQQKTDQGGEAPVTGEKPGTVVGQDAIAHAHDCVAGAACNDLR